MFALLRPNMQCTESTTFSAACDDELQPTFFYDTPMWWTDGWAIAYSALSICAICCLALKRATSFLNKQSGTQFYDWKPMRSIIDIYTKISRRTIYIPGDFQTPWKNKVQQLQNGCIIQRQCRRVWYCGCRITIAVVVEILGHWSTVAMAMDLTQRIHIVSLLRHTICATNNTKWYPVNAAKS